MATFTPIDTHPEVVRQLAAALADEYAVTGDATHAVTMATGEVGVAYPLYEGRMILLYPGLETAQARIDVHAKLENAPNEDAEAALWDQINALPCPDEFEMDESEARWSDNGDGTFSVDTRASLF